MPTPRKLHAVQQREGNPGHRSIPEAVKLPPGAPPEPSWVEPFPLPALAKPPGRRPPAPPRARKGASEEERTAASMARLAWALEVAEWNERRHAAEDAKVRRAEARRCRSIAHASWVAIVPILDAQGLLATADAVALKDHCILQARIDQAERDITRHGIWAPGQRGGVKNPSTTFVNQCREKDRPYLLDFGLTPGARDKLNPRKGDDDEEGLFG